MTGLRFKVGELAIFAVAQTVAGSSLVGERCEVIAVGPFRPGDILAGAPVADSGDYAILFADCKGTLADDYQLRKIDPPAEPASLTRESECEVVA